MSPVVKDEARSIVRFFPNRVRKRLIHSVKKRSSREDINNYIKRGGTLRINIGAQGNRPNGWLNVDISPGPHLVYLDATDMKDVPSDTFDAVLCEHMIEHVSSPNGLAVMRSIYRILKPGGVARFVTPNMQKLALAVSDPSIVARDIELFMGEFRNSEIGKNHPKMTAVDYINVMFREWGHQYLYTPADLAAKLRETGFDPVVETKASVFSSVFDGAQGHGRMPNGEINDLDVFAIEAIKPRQ